MIKFSKHFINNLLTFRTLNFSIICEKLKLTSKAPKVLKNLYTCLILNLRRGSALSFSYVLHHASTDSWLNLTVI